MAGEGIPLTVIGGYLGAGKTTLANRLLREPGGRRLGVIVNDFGALAIDAELLAGAGAGDVISLPNGCVCCTLGADLQQALAAMIAVADVPDQIVIEVSGVADPAATAAWGTVPPFAPGGVIVLAAADSIRRQANDRYVGGEVRRQLAGADLVVLTKTDLVDDEAVAAIEAWCVEQSAGAPILTADRGELPVDVVLGQRPASIVGDGRLAEHEDLYERVAWSSPERTTLATLRAVLDDLPVEVLRLKGFVVVEGGSVVTVDVVGRRREVCAIDATDRSESVLVAIGRRARLDPIDLRRRLGVLGPGRRD